MNILKQARQPLSRRAFAKILGVSAEAVRKWEMQLDNSELIPADRVLPIVRALGNRIKPYELRPDIYPDPHWFPPSELPQMVTPITPSSPPSRPTTDEETPDE